MPEIQTVQVVGQPTGWAAMAEDIRKYDEDKVKECRDDIDTLMTFVSHVYIGLHLHPNENFHRLGCSRLLSLHFW